ncbi:MAG: hypothetical protein KKF52_02525 [Nanoarchaeota archaeon]|nr:hypothetical protein [Nanoarchaeota archaeon]MBU4242084.1 hypothetical protein [Nanoarchaeota archaeon]MBU4351536.1 hypothetical protein [Nanoarchaeota archaeon]
MKHNLKAILIILALFFAAQLVGLAITEAYILKPELPLNIERPQVTEEQKSFTFIPIAFFILIATGIVLLLFKFGFFRVWKFWFLLSVWLTLTISFNAFIAEKFAIIFALIFAFWKVFKNNVYVHNFTEVFIYGALVAIFAPILNITSAIILLLFISLYDYIAVRKTKHMVTLAESQHKTKLFAGLMLPYKKGKKTKIIAKTVSKVSTKKSKISVAILGGGDIGFPLLFAGIVMREMQLLLFSFKVLIVPICAAIALFSLFYFGKDKKYYPAMPYITAGCLIGYLLVYLL